MPKWVQRSLIVLAAASLIPLALVARARVIHSPRPRVHLVPDMDKQGRYGSQSPHERFADGRAMRLPVDGTVARGQLNEDDHLYRGVVGADYAATLPLPLTRELLERGRDRYDIYCSPCHGLAGYGDGMVALRADALQQGTWVPPSSFHDEPASARGPGHLFNSISMGIRTMPAYGSLIPVEDRWAVVAYVMALQRSQRARLTDVPAESRAQLEGTP